MTDQHTCKGCEQTFTPARKNQVYCSRQCQKRSTRNATRGSRAIENKQRSEVHYKRANDLFYMINGVAPKQRLGAMKDILDCIPHDAGLRNILTDPVMLKEQPRVDGRKNVVQAASAYTKMFFGVSITTYIKQVKAETVDEEFPVQSMSALDEPAPRPILPHGTCAGCHRQFTPKSPLASWCDECRVDPYICSTKTPNIRQQLRTKVKYRHGLFTNADPQTCPICASGGSIGCLHLQKYFTTKTCVAVIYISWRDYPPRGVASNLTRTIACLFPPPSVLVQPVQRSC